MDARTDGALGRAFVVARQFLGRWRDCFTCSTADDLAQEATIEAWLRWRTLRRPERWDAFVRTISRRFRCRALMHHLRTPVQSLDAEPELLEQLAIDPPPSSSLRVAGRLVPVQWCLRQLPAVLAGLDPLNARILRSYYEGFSCGELAERYSLSEEGVKVRLYRSRTRIRREFEGRVRAARLGGEPHSIGPTQQERSHEASSREEPPHDAGARADRDTVVHPADRRAG